MHGSKISSRDGTKRKAFIFRPALIRYIRRAKWLERAGGALDGVVAKRLDQPYEAGERAMIKVKRLRTADCVVGGFRFAENSNQVGSLLLGLYDLEGRLDHVGFTSGFARLDRTKLTQKLLRLRKPPGFTGRAPGGPSRWSTEHTVNLTHPDKVLYPEQGITKLALAEYYEAVADWIVSIRRGPMC